MKLKFNNQYTRLLKPMLTGSGFTPPTGTEWEQLIFPLMWAVRNDDLLKAHDRKKKKYNNRVPTPEEPYPEFVPEPAIGPPPARTRGRVDFVVYFLVGPMAMGLHGYPTAHGFDLIQGPESTSDRSTTSRKAQRLKQKQERLLCPSLTVHHSLTHSLTHSRRTRRIKEIKHKAVQEGRDQRVAKRNKEASMGRERKDIMERMKMAQALKVSSDQDIENEIKLRQAQVSLSCVC